MRWIYISPHLDDAVLSAGGLIYEQTRAGMDVEIWTLYVRFPSQRRTSLHLLKCFIINGVFPPLQKWFQPAVQKILKPPALSARKLSTLIFWIVFTGAAKMETGCTQMSLFLHMKTMRIYPLEWQNPFPPASSRPINWSANLALGSHLDHVLVRRAVELLQRPILYDVDIPYLFNSPAELAPKTAGMKANTHRITDSGLRSWQDAIAAYKSQLSGSVR